jgi:hypothetical protein
MHGADDGEENLEARLIKQFPGRKLQIQTLINILHQVSRRRALRF